MPISNKKFFLNLIAIILIVIIHLELKAQNVSFNHVDEVLAQNVFPYKTIKQGDLEISVFMPDSANGFYRSTRFDWAGMIGKIKYKNHTFTKLKRPPHNPLDPVGVLSLAESFNKGLGFDSAALGENFVKIGIGVLKKNNLKPENLDFQTIINSGKRNINITENSITFTHKLKSELGFAYIYTKKIQINAKGNILTVFHEIENIGTKKIIDQNYSHNYFNLDDQPIGPSYKAIFTFPVSLLPKKGMEEFYKTDNNTLHLVRDFKNDNNDWVFFGVNLIGFGTEKAYKINLENELSKTGVEIGGNSKIEKIYYWSDNKNTCPVVFINISVNPGEKQTWENTYRFYEIK